MAGSRRGRRWGDTDGVCGTVVGLSRGRQRAEFARLVEVLAGAPWVGPASAQVWAGRLQALGEEGPRLAVSLLRGYRHGALDRVRWLALAGEAASAAPSLDEAISLLWDAFVTAGLVRASSSENWTQVITPAVLRRWAWQPRWHMMEQDEDLLFMRDELVPELLAVAADRHVPKREYMLEIVGHHARDSCCQAAYHGEQLPETLLRVAGWAPLAAAAGAMSLAAYLERLGGHAIPGPVDRGGALQRLRDLGRCAEPTIEAVRLREVDGAWQGLIIHSAGNRCVSIDAATGRIVVVKPPPRTRK